jgi:hypothetical protein
VSLVVDAADRPRLPVALLDAPGDRRARLRDASSRTREGTSPRWHASLECDPAPFLLDGFGCVASVRPAATRWKLGVAAYALTIPDLVLPDSNAGFHVEIRPSFNLLVAYRLGRRPRGG